MKNYNDNPILIDVNSRKRNQIQKIFWVLCSKEKIELICINLEENRYKCPRCKMTYHPSFEIFPQEDILESSHEEEEDSAGLLVAAEDEFSKDNDTSKSDISIPKYMQDSETTKVTYFREEWFIIQLYGLDVWMPQLENIFECFLDLNLTLLL